MNKQTVYLDMDGTIADLYNQHDWLARLRSEDTTVFDDCTPLVDEATLYSYYPQDTYNIVILSMTPKHASQGYCNEVIKAKNNWLNKYFPSIAKRIYMPYGNNKNLKNSQAHILIDDNEEIRNNYKGQAFYPHWLWGL